MTDIGLFTVSSYLAQALLAVLLAVLLQRFFHNRHHPYLGHWAWSWWALGAAQLGAVIAFALATELPASSPWLLGIFEPCTTAPMFSIIMFCVTPLAAENWPRLG